MSGYKQTIFADAPVTFWSFDFDQIGVGATIIDEINNQNPLVIQSDINGAVFTYSESLNLLETSNQSSISIAEDGKDPTFGYRNQYFEAQHTTTFDFPNRGEYSIEFLVYKESPSTVRSAVGEPAYSANLESPVILKQGTMSIYFIDYFSPNPSLGTSDALVFIFYPLKLNGLLPKIQFNDPEHGSMYDRTLHCIASMSVEQVDVTVFQATYRVFVNGRLIGTDTATFFNGPPISADPNFPWLIAGTSGDPQYGFNTELLKLDQIQIYNYGIGVEQAAIHYRKTKSYEDQIKTDFPVHYWQLNDTPIAQDFTVESSLTSGLEGTAVGGVTKGQQGNLDIINSSSMGFQGNSAVYFEKLASNNFSQLVNISSDYTVEFWFKSNDSTRGLLFDSGQEDPEGNWIGLRVFLNSKDNAQFNGGIQFSETYTNYVNSRPLDALDARYDFNDSQWHHVAVRRNGLEMSLVIDGLVHNTLDSIAITSSSARPSQIALMNGRPGSFQLSGNMMQVAYYDYALQDHQVYNRWRFNNRYRVSGVTLLQGVPITSQLRFYDSLTGELVHQLLSDPLTGQYEFHPMNNRYLDVVSRLPDVTTARHRIHGPVQPGEFNDVHI